MAIPIVYNLRSMKVRWLTAVAAVLGIAGTVGVFVAMLALAHGFRATLVNSGLAGKRADSPRRIFGGTRRLGVARSGAGDRG